MEDQDPDMSDVADGGKRFFDYNPITKETEYFYSDADGENFTIETVQDVTEIAKYNKELYKENSGRWKGDFHQVASIPNVIYWELWRQGIVQDEEKFKEWMNDPDNRVFRTRDGKI
jgi:hypothetical protein